MSRIKYYNQETGTWEYADSQYSVSNISGGNVNQSGLTAAQISALDGMFKVCAYNGDPADAYAAFKTAFGLSESGGEVEPDVPVVPDEPDEPEVKTYTVTSGLTNVESTLPSVIVNEGDSYTATLTAADGYELDAVTVTMGGVDITATAYADGVVTIASVTGNVIVTASAVEVSTDINNGWVDGEPYAIEWTDGYKVDVDTGADVEDSTKSVSNYLPCAGNLMLKVEKGLYLNYGIFFYDADKNFIGRLLIQNNYSTNFDPDNFHAAVYHGAYFVRVYKGISATTNIGVTPYKPAILNASTVAETGEMCLAAEEEIGTSFNVNTGALITAADKRVTELVLCYGFSAIYCQNSNRSWYAFYDADKKYIKTYVKQGGTGCGVSVPSNACYFRYGIYDAMTKWWFALTDDVWCVNFATLTQTTATNHTGYLFDVKKGESYTSTLTAKSGYVLSTVTVKMDNVDITDTVYSDGVINIPSVTGHVEITAVSVAEGA